MRWRPDQPLGEVRTNSAEWGSSKVRTPWVIFMDNDVLPGEGWVERLVATAEASGAGFQKWFQKRIFVPVESAVCAWVTRQEERRGRKYLNTVTRLGPVNGSVKLHGILLEGHRGLLQRPI